MERLDEQMRFLLSHYEDHSWWRRYKYVYLYKGRNKSELNMRFEEVAGPERETTTKTELQAATESKQKRCAHR